MDSEMTPLDRLIPQDSGPQDLHRTEDQAPRIGSSNGGGAVPPLMMSGSSSDSRGDELVTEILQDTEHSSKPHDDYQPPPTERRSPPPQSPPREEQAHPSEYQEPQFVERQVHFEDESLPVVSQPPPSPRYQDDSDEKDYIGMILEEMKLPLIVAILILGANAGSLDSTMGKIIPALMNGDSLGYAGIVVKAVIGGLLFYALRRIFL